MPEDTHEDVRRRLFEAAWDVPAYAPAPERTVPRARRRAATTIGGGVLAAVLAIVVAASSFPLDSGETLGTQPTDVDDREFLVDISTGETTEISNVSAMKGAAGFDVSPDGRRIVFGKVSSGTWSLFVADLDGSASRPLTQGFLDVDDPAWSPNGREIAFGGLREGETVRSIFVVNVANGRVRKLLRTSRDVRTPEWSPNGRSILYGVTVPAPPSTVGEGFFVPNNWTFQLRMVDVETGRIEKVAGGRKTGAVDGTFPAMEGIVFLWEHDFVAGFPQRVDLAVLRRTEERPESLFEIPLGDQELAWSPQVSPDGATIAYIREVQGRTHVFLFDLETEENRRLRAGFDATWVDHDTLLIQDRPASDS
jgi:WD40 repeat protein